MLPLCCHPLQKLRMGIWTSIYSALRVKGCFPSLGSLILVAYGANLWCLLKLVWESCPERTLSESGTLSKLVFWQQGQGRATAPICNRKVNSLLIGTPSYILV